jgi:hypothetical protein
LAAHSVSPRLRVSLSNSSVFAASPWLILRKCKFNWLAKNRQRPSARPIAGRHNRNHQLKLKCPTTANHDVYGEYSPDIGAKAYTKNAQTIIGRLDVPHWLAASGLFDQIGQRDIHQAVALHFIQLAAQM